MSNKIVKRESNLPASSVSAWGEIAAEEGSQTLLKYEKGDWKIGEDDVPLGTKYVAFIDELACCFIKFVEDEAPQLRLGKVKLGKDKLPTRLDCGDSNQDDWEIENGEPKDPWQQVRILPLSPVDRVGELVVFSAISVGSRGAVADLCGIYDRSPRNGLLPIIALGTSSYPHKKYGKVHTPVLKFVSWYQAGGPVVTEDDPVPSESDYGADFDDNLISKN
jgi:hypothetical protein